MNASTIAWKHEYRSIRTIKIRSCLFLFAAVSLILLLPKTVFTDEKPQPVEDVEFFVESGRDKVARIFTMALSPDGKSIVSGGPDGKLRIWDTTTGEQNRLLEGHTNAIYSVCFSPDGNNIVSGSSDKTLRIWDFKSGVEKRKHVNNNTPIYSVAITPDGKTIAFGGADGILRFWYLEGEQNIKEYSGDRGTIFSIAISPNGKMVAFEGFRDTIEILDLNTLESEFLMKENYGFISSLCISPNNKYVISGGQKGVAVLWKISKEGKSKKFYGLKETIQSSIFSPDGRFIFTGSWDKTVRRWEIESGKEVERFTGHTGSVYSVIVSRDGETLYSGDTNGRIKMWNVSEGRLLVTLAAFKDGQWVTFFPDGDYFCSSLGQSYVYPGLGVNQRRKSLPGTTFPNKSEVFIQKTSPTNFATPIVSINYLKTDSSILEPKDQTIGSSTVQVHVSAFSSGGGLKKIAFLLDNKEIASKTFGGKEKLEYSQTLHLENKVNRLKVVAYGNDELKGISKEIKLTCNKSTSRILAFEEDLPVQWKNLNRIDLNGKTVSVKKVDLQDRTIEIAPLGPREEIGELMKPGINFVSTTLSGMKSSLLFWKERRKLKPFEHPYKESHAILVAIDDYDRQHDPQNRGKTGFKSLDNTMVANAEKLKMALQEVGFPADHIYTYYNEAAESGAIEKALRQFWVKSTGRLLFYFGGHGMVDKITNNGYLVTYDYQPDRPSITTIPMEDLTLRHAREVKAHHMLILLDACYSGLALRTLSQKPDAEELKEFRKLSIIRSYTTPKARDIMLASTGSQVAFWRNGGIFTKYLIKGLQGDADINHDNIIQFNELDLYVTNKVIQETSQYGRQQKPVGFGLNRFGDGKVIFIIPKYVKGH